MLCSYNTLGYYEMTFKAYTAWNYYHHMPIISKLKPPHSVNPLLGHSVEIGEYSSKSDGWLMMGALRIQWESKWLNPKWAQSNNNNALGMWYQPDPTAGIRNECNCQLWYDCLDIPPNGSRIWSSGEQIKTIWIIRDAFQAINEYIKATMILPQGI